MIVTLFLNRTISIWYYNDMMQLMYYHNELDNEYQSEDVLSSSYTLTEVREYIKRDKTNWIIEDTGDE